MMMDRVIRRDALDASADLSTYGNVHVAVAPLDGCYGLYLSCEDAATRFAVCLSEHDTRRLLIDLFTRLVVAPQIDEDRDRRLAWDAAHPRRPLPPAKPRARHLTAADLRAMDAADAAALPSEAAR